MRREIDQTHRALNLPGHRRTETANLSLQAQDLTRQALLLGLEQFIVDQLLQPQADQLALLAGLDAPRLEQVPDPSAVQEVAEQAVGASWPGGTCCWSRCRRAS